MIDEERREIIKVRWAEIREERERMRDEDGATA